MLQLHFFDFLKCIYFFVLVSTVKASRHNGRRSSDWRNSQKESQKRDRRGLINDKSNQQKTNGNNSQGISSNKTKRTANNKHRHSHYGSILHKKDEIFGDAKGLYDSKLSMNGDPSMNLMQGSILEEQKHEKEALKDDAAFENDALASLREDENKIDDDEKKVNEDRKRKFGKHRKQKTRNENEINSILGRNNVDNNDENEQEKPTDLFTKIREFAASIYPSEINKKPKTKSKRQIKEDIAANEKRLNLDDDTLQSYINDDNNANNVDETSQTPSQILGNIAEIFENVNNLNEENVDDTKLRKRKDTIPESIGIRNTIPKPLSFQERKVKDVIPRPPKEIDEHILEKHFEIGSK